ncbi:MAG TPA: polysaccharide pyruvyl transferase family protein [Holophaga sp.]|nr:polysaccharide pyruvyl transferase family protein [Holophaga sp.]
MNFLVDAFIDNNLGDDLMLELLVQRFPAITFFCLRDAKLNAQAPYRDWPNLLVPDWADLDRILPFMDGLLIFGGSAWQDHGNNLDWFGWRTKALKTLKARGCPALAIGNNIGPVSTEEGRQLFVALLRRFDCVVVRDQASHAWMEDNVGPDRGKLGADLVLNYPVPCVDREAGLVGISVHRTVLFPERNAPYVEHMVLMVRALRKARPDLRFRFLAFDTITENDEILVDQILARLAWPAWASKATYRGDIPAFLDAFGACDRIFASRFHALVLALLFGQPFVPFDYMGKTGNLLQDLSYEGIRATHDGFEGQIDAICTQLLHPRPCFDGQAFKTMKERASINFSEMEHHMHQASPSAFKRTVLSLLGRAPGRD